MYVGVHRNLRRGKVGHKHMPPCIVVQKSICILPNVIFVLHICPTSMFENQRKLNVRHG